MKIGFCLPSETENMGGDTASGAQILRMARLAEQACHFERRYPVPPENVIQAETDTSIEDLGNARVASNGKYLRNVGRLGAKIARSRRCVRTRTSVATTSEPVQELKPRGDSDDAARRLAESRPPLLRMDARLDVAPVHYIPAKDERVSRDSMRSSSPEFVARGPR